MVEQTARLASLSPTRFARLTAAGRSAVATVAVFGPAATATVNQFFQPASGMSLEEIPLGQIIFGRWRSSGGSGEELVVCRHDDNRVDIHCHGGDAAVERIQDSLASSGSVAGEGSQLMAFEEEDALKIEAWQAMMHARTRRGALLMLAQYHGALRKQLNETLSAMQSGQWELAREQLQRMEQYANVGLHVSSPWKVVLVGAPNVGKSSLLNKLSGFRRSIVDDQPGTTRDLLTTYTAWDGWPIELVDTAGLREGADSVEQEGIDKVWQYRQQVDLVMLVFAGQHCWSAECQRLCDSFSAPLIIYNKSDLIERAEMTDGELPGVVERPRGVLTSAVTGDGLERLIDAMLSRLVPVAPGPDEAVPYTEVQCLLIRDLLHLLDKGQIRQGIDRLGQFLQASCPHRLLQES